jgi:transposase-like protein
LEREYSDESAARLKFEQLRWGKGCQDIACPHCRAAGLDNSYRVRIMPRSSTRPGLWRCRSCKRQFTVTKGTVFEDTHVPLTKWLLALSLLVGSKTGVSAHEVHRTLNVKYQTAGLMMRRLRHDRAATRPMLSLAPLTVDEALAALLRTAPSPVEKKPRTKKGGRERDL